MELRVEYGLECETEYGTAGTLMELNGYNNIFEKGYNAMGIINRRLPGGILLYIKKLV